MRISSCVHCVNVDPHYVSMTFFLPLLNVLFVTEIHRIIWLVEVLQNQKQGICEALTECFLFVCMQVYTTLACTVYWCVSNHSVVPL